MRAIPFESRVEMRGPDECWPYLGRIDRFGYGRLSQSALAHRKAFQVANPDINIRGKTICHSCDNPACCNPSHLWCGTQAENLKDMSIKGRARGQSKSHCVHGHAFDEVNTLIRALGVRRRQCRQCANNAAKRSQARHRSAASA